MKVIITLISHTEPNLTTAIIKLRDILGLSVNETRLAYDKMCSCDPNEWYEVELLNKLRNLGWLICYKSQEDINNEIEYKNKMALKEKLFSEANSWYESLDYQHKKYVDILMENRIVICSAK